MIKEAVKAVGGMVKSRVARYKTERALQGHLMQDFFESRVGMKNQATISKTIRGHIKAGKPEDAIRYADSQERKVRAEEVQLGVKYSPKRKLQPRYK